MTPACVRARWEVPLDSLAPDCSYGRAAPATYRIFEIASPTHTEPIRQDRGQSRVLNLLLCPRDVVHHATVSHPVRVAVIHHICGSRVAVARLPDAAGIHQVRAIRVDLQVLAAMLRRRPQNRLYPR